MSSPSSHLASEAPMPLWAQTAPGSLGQGDQDTPTLTCYRPAAGTVNGASMLVLPGGGYAILAPHEGEGYARWLAGLGVTAYVLKYRLGTSRYRHPAMLQDAARGLRMVRSWARRDGLDPARVGIIGSSAGGHLASTLLTHFDAGAGGSADPVEQESSRPDLGILCYPVVNLIDYPHQGSRINLLGETAPEDLVRHLSNDLQVTSQTPPCFIWHTAEDAVVPVENAFLFASALRRSGVPFALHVYEKGVHGLGLPDAGRGAPPWHEACELWLRGRGFL